MATLDVLWLPSELAALHRGPRTVIVIDAIRATTSIATALAAGAARVIPASSVERAREVAELNPGALLCGERNGLPPSGFDLGNSPGDFTPEAVAGRTLVFTTTNGTRAVETAARAGRVVLACFRNGAAVAASLAREGSAEDGSVAIVCAGRKGRISMDDAWCAGHLVERIDRAASRTALEDGAVAARALARAEGTPTRETLARTSAGRALVALGLGDDLACCATIDDLEVVPILRDGAFVSGGEEDADVG